MSSCVPRLITEFEEEEEVLEEIQGRGTLELNQSDFESITSSLPIQIEKRDEKGWGVVARKEFSQGEIVFEEAATLDIILDKNACRGCYTLLRGKDKRVYCPTCKIELYCSQECMEHTLKVYHRALCGTNSTKLMKLYTRKEWLRLDPFTPASLPYITYILYGRCKILGTPFQDIIPMLSGFKKRRIHHSALREVHLILLNEFLQVDPKAEEQFSYEIWVDLFSVLSINLFEIASQSTPLRSVLGTCVSFLNHNVNSNVRVDFERMKLKVVATKNISKGQELEMFYGSHCPSRYYLDFLDYLQIPKSPTTIPKFFTQ